MFIKDWKREVLTIPNGLSLIRLLLIPVYTVIYLEAQQYADYFLAAIILAISCITDAIDGFVARQFNMVSQVGKILDPLADKLTQLTLTVCLSIRHPMLRGVLILLVAKEILQTVTVWIMFRQGKVLPGPLIIGKICTAVLFIGFIFLILMPQISAKAVLIITVTDSLFLVTAFVGYFFAFFGGKSPLKELPE